MYIKCSFLTARSSKVLVSSSSIYSIIIIFHQVWLLSYVESLLSLLYVRHIKLLYLIHTIVPRHKYFCQKINDNIIISKIFNDIKTLYHIISPWKHWVYLPILGRKSVGDENVTCEPQSFKFITLSSGTS